jgi:1-acyl-sn-glycerol-3-phosphate acyltransferase
LLVLSLLGLGAAWYFLLRNVLEQCLEFLVWPIYRIDAVGPGLEQFPRRGPVLVLANHASWMDPLWVGKVVPRPFTPMMTATFFDKPVLRWLMTRVVHAIRVPESRFRREAPELDDAIKVLDREGVLLVFPEGMMRRKDEKLLARPFGQGVWRILKERPATPVVPFWIEGGWGSFMSYKGGPPTVNKRMDWWRPIRIGVGPVQVVDAALLEDQRATRTHLMQACIECRHYLGLEVPPPDGPSEEEKEPASEGPEPES